MKKTTNKAQKAYIALLTFAIFAIFNVIPAYAAGGGGGGGGTGGAGFDTGSILTNMETALKVVLSITGAGVAIFGVMHLIEAQASQDPNAKSQGVKQLAAGLGIIVLANLLIPVFIDAINFG